MRRRLGSIFRSSSMGHSTPSRSLGSWPLPQCCLSHHLGSRHPHRRRSGWSQGWALYWSVETQSSSGQNWWITETRGVVTFLFLLMRALLIPYPINTRYSYNTFIFSAKGHIAIKGNTVKCQEIVHFQAATRGKWVSVSTRGTLHTILSPRCPAFSQGTICHNGMVGVGRTSTGCRTRYLKSCEL